MSNILIRPAELRQTSEQLRASAKKIAAALQAIDQEILSLKGDKFLGNRANAVQAHYAPKREALLKAQSIVADFANDLLDAAIRFEQADKTGGQLGSSTPSQPAKPANPPVGKMPKISDIALNMWDKRWRDIDMNNKTGTEDIGDYGCLLTVLAMICKANGVDMDPKRVDAWMDANGGYQPGGSLAYLSKQEAFLESQLGRDVSRTVIYERGSPNYLPNIQKNLDSGVPVILHIDSASNPRDGHFVLAVGTDDKGNYICADPNGGKQVAVSVKNIRGARVYN